MTGTGFVEKMTIVSSWKCWAVQLGFPGTFEYGLFMAERVGFEPTVTLLPHLLSREALST